MYYTYNPAMTRLHILDSFEMVIPKTEATNFVVIYHCMHILNVITIIRVCCYVPVQLNYYALN